ncbi:MAG: GNAT family N-acetyltransferase [Verrucomicrobiales bacterium]
MGDLLVKLYELPEAAESLRRASASGYRISRPLAPEKRLVTEWVENHFGSRWAGEAEMAFSGHPITCFVAMDGSSRLVGFACYDVTFRGFFGPAGVGEKHRGKGIGTALMLRSFHAMAESGYAYAVIGQSGADAYFKRTVGAIPVEGSDPGPYRARLELE